MKNETKEYQSWVKLQKEFYKSVKPMDEITNEYYECGRSLNDFI